MYQIEQEMHIKSLNGGLDRARIIDKVGDNNYIAEYKGKKCSAIFNPFASRYFVDDVGGVIITNHPKSPQASDFER